MKILHFLDKNAEKVLCSALLGISCIVLFLQIVFRVAGSPLPWSEELGRYMFIWLIYIGSSAAIREASYFAGPDRFVHRFQGSAYHPNF